MMPNVEDTKAFYEEKTNYSVFVLGAGASSHLKYPLGAELAQSIVDSCDEGKDGFCKLMEMGFEKEVILDFREKFQHSTKITIDQFLALRSEYAAIGKAAIAIELVKFEDRDELFKKVGNWYSYLSSLASESIDHAEVKFCIVSFNYDRSLEYYLQGMFNTNYVERIGGEFKSKTIQNYVPIYKVHGSLGHIPEFVSESPKRKYSCNVQPKELRLSSEKIMVPYELKESGYTDDMTHAQKAIKNAEKVYFLGFGYDEVNLHRLGLALGNEHWGMKGQFKGTSFKLSSKIKNKILKMGVELFDIELGQFMKDIESEYI